MPPPLDLPTLEALLRRYQSDADSVEPLRALRQARRELAEQLLAADAADVCERWDRLRGLHRLLLDSGLRDEFPSDDDAAFASTLLHPQTPGAALAAMLYHRPFQLPLTFDLPAVPDWLRGDWLRYLLEGPSVFPNLGDADAHLAHTRRVVDYIHAQVIANPGDIFWLQTAGTLLVRLKIFPLYFTAADLSPILIQRGELLDLVLRASGHHLDHSFPPRDANRRIRLGVLCNLMAAETGAYATLPLFEHLDRSRFEVILYYARSTGTAAEEYCRRRVDRAVQVPENLTELVAALRAEDLDLLHFVPNVASTMSLWTKVAAHRLARVQFTNFASPVTTGMGQMDYFISGVLSEPDDAAAKYRERLVLLDGAGFGIDPSPAPTESSIRLDPFTLRIPEKTSIVFASGANYFKLVPELLAAWLRILAAAPNSVLLLYPFGSWSESYPVAAFMRRMREVFRRAGIDANRLIVAPRLAGRAEVKELLKNADVYLDSFPHSGSHSLLDALETGLPSVALHGVTLRGRHGAAMLLEMGLDELVTRDEHQYVTLAAQLAADADRRAGIARRIAAALDPPPPFLHSRAYAAKVAPLYESWLAATAAGG